LYNADTNAVDLSGYFLTDLLADPTKFVIPTGTTLGGQAFKLVWADKTSSSNAAGGDLHVSFKLSKSGSELGLFDPGGVMVDGFAFGPQTDDVSIGRYPDGADLPLLTLDVPTPGSTNFLAGGNRPPIFQPLPAQTVPEGQRLTFTVTAVDPDPGQHVTYSSHRTHRLPRRSIPETARSCGPHPSPTDPEPSRSASALRTTVLRRAPQRSV